MNDRLANYLDAADIQVTNVTSSGRTMAENAGLDDETGMRLAVDLGARAFTGTTTPDAVIMPGGRWITLGAIRELEERFGRPVLTNYVAGLWAALRGLQPRPILGWGRLLSSLGQSEVTPSKA